MVRRQGALTVHRIRVIDPFSCESIVQRVQFRAVAALKCNLPVNPVAATLRHTKGRLGRDRVRSRPARGAPDQSSWKEYGKSMREYKRV